MKIGIVTLWNTEDNYGGIMQTYALQRYLRNEGHDAYIIRLLYYAGTYSKLKRIIKKILVCLHLLKADFTHRRNVVSRNKVNHRLFSEFRKKYISCSTYEYHSLFSIRLFPPSADCYITGSDQVWAMPLSDPREAWHYLNFGNRKTRRISYAASFGHDVFPKNDEEKFKSYIKDFYRISVREKSGLRICESMGFNAVLAIDSTFLLEADIYKKIMSAQKYSSKYAYIYSVNMSTASEIYWDVLKKELVKLKYEMVATTASGYSAARELFTDVNYDYATPTEWLSNIYHSSVVLTSSFHGIAFSILFKKEFIYFPLKSKYKSGNDRITDLLAIVGLENRIAFNEVDALNLLYKNIDYNNIDTNKLEDLIFKSKQYLKECLSFS